MRPFTDKQIELVQTFADQAAIAIENVRLFEEIQDKSRQLEEASKHKSQFLASMSHELRTPLNAVIGVTEMLLEDAHDLKRHDEVEPLDRVLRAARHLLALINDILDLSKIEAGRMELHLETFPLTPVIDDVAKTIEPMAAKNANRIIIDCPADLGTMHADQTRFRQALLNLASNANKFTEQGTVTIAAQAQLLDGRRATIPLLAVTSPQVKPDADRMGLTARIEAAGGSVLSGMCFYQIYAREMAEANGWRRLATNSAKLVNILGGYGYKPALLSMEACVEAACNGGRIGR